MKRRNLLAIFLLPLLTACQGGWPFKPKSKPPPVKRYEPTNTQVKNLFDSTTNERLFDEYFPSEEERLDKQIKYYKMLNDKWNT